MNKKKLIGYSVKIAIVIIMIVVFFIINDTINQNNAKKETEGYKYSVDKLIYDEDICEVRISGWCIKEGIACSTLDSRKHFKIFLAENGDLDNLIEIPVESYIRQDVAIQFNNGESNYLYSGFNGSVKVDSKITEKKFRVLIQ